jgi:ABC-2 type transport system permease protein
MPTWAQFIGEVLPATHFLRVVRGVMLKGADASQIAAEVLSLGLLLLIISAIAMSRYRVTLD